jgi:pilus assembly protein TadC
MNVVLGAMGSGFDWQLPAIVGLGMAGVLFFAPDLEVRRRAAAARTEFRRALGAFVELAALCRNAGIGVTQSLELAANVADTWVFARLSSALQEAAYAGRNAWTALEVVANELDIPDLADVADIMELSGAHGSSVYSTLRAQAAGLRNSMMAAEQGDSRSATEKLNGPLAGIGVLFFILLLIPALHNIVTS